VQASLQLLLTGPTLTVSRARRIRCDESFPACHRCVSTGRICDGYGIWGGGGGSLQATGLESINRSGGPKLKAILPRLVISPSPGPRISTEEQYYLEWIVTGTATYAPAVFAQPFWAPIFPSAIIQNHMVLNALLALSATHKRMILDPANSAREGLPPDAQEIFMLRQYCGGMRNLYAHLHERGPPSRSQLLLAVITCAIFVLMEATRGHYDAAYIHAMSGTQLAQRLVDMGGGDSLDAHHVSFFARVNDQMTVFRQRQRSGGHGSPLTNDMAKVRFDSPTDAKQHLCAVVEINAMAIEQVSAIPNPTAALRARRREDHAYYSSCFIAWHLAFKATITDKALSTTPEEALEWQALEEQYNYEKTSAEKVFQMDLVA
jgi:hypothetical protein